MNIMYLRKIGGKLKAILSPASKSVIQEVEGLSVGSETIIEGSIEIRKRGGEINIGEKSLISGIITTETEYSKVNIGNNVYIGGRSLLDCVCSITIEDDVLISYECIIQDSDNHSTNYNLRKKDTADWMNNQYHNWETTPQRPIKLLKGCWLGARVIILKGVTVGRGAVVGAGSVVTKNVSDWTIVAGNPARFIRDIPLNEREQ
jgi:acetyltransferase-like isoleucine patch superfamily enzyme